MKHLLLLACAARSTGIIFACQVIMSAHFHLSSGLFSGMDDRDGQLYTHKSALLVDADGVAFDNGFTVSNWNI